MAGGSAVGIEDNFVPEGLNVENPGPAAKEEQAGKPKGAVASTSFAFQYAYQQLFMPEFFAQ